MMRAIGPVTVYYVSVQLILTRFVEIGVTFSGLQSSGTSLSVID